MFIVVGSSSSRPADGSLTGPLRIALLGRFATSIGGAPWTFTAPPKTLPLLAYLLLHAGEVIRRDRLSFLFWPDSDEADAKANLRRHLHYLQRGLPRRPEPWILTDARTVAWNPATPFSFDVAEFVAASSSDETREAAVALYGGDLLEEIFADDWLIPERERLRNMQFANLGALVPRFRIARNHARALQYAELMLAMDPWREDALRHVMSLRDELGNRAGALAEFDRFTAVLSEQLGVEPMPETIALYETIRDQSGVFTDLGQDPEPDARAAARRTEFSFVGRDDELQALRSAWVRATRGSGSALLIGGEAGIGKSRLAAALSEIASAEGARILWGHTGSVEASPYRAMLDALRSGLRLLEAAQLDDVWLSSVASLLPQLRTRRPDLPPLAKIAPEHEQTRVFETFGRAFEAIARSRPLLLILEDLHWAGSTSIALFEHLVRRIGDTPILILGTFREEELSGSHPLREFRRRVSRERMIATIPLGPLALPELQQLVAHVPGIAQADASALAARLFTESGGNPFYIGELLRIREDTAETGDTPRAGTIAATIAARLEHLSAPARSIARFASTIGSGFDLELLVAASGWTEADVLAGLHELIDRHIVRDAGFSAEDYAFSHHLMQSAIYAGVPPDEARRRHRRIAIVMEELQSDRIADIAAQLALHFDRGAVPDRASEFYLSAATRALALFANDEAARY
ncbi:MAG TPA: AAA family ATPase, partial [Xanthomonadales bacterium]|nr:AAA family ATPase [Xanthomonadales bacterium]